MREVCHQQGEEGEHNGLGGKGPEMQKKGHDRLKLLDPAKKGGSGRDVRCGSGSAGFATPGQNLLQFIEILGRQLLPLRKVNKHGFDGSAEDAIQKGIGGSGNALVLGDERAIAKNAAVGGVREGPLFHQAPEERPDGLGVPGGIRLGEAVGDLARRCWMSSPNDTHDLPFGVRDPGNRVLHGNTRKVMV